MLAAALVAGRAEITLTDVKQQKAAVEILSASPSEISFVVRGQKGVIPTSQLTEESRIAALDYAKAKGVYRAFPPFTVQVKIAYQRRNSDAAWYKKNVKLNSSIVIAGEKKMAGLPAAEATLLIITHDTKAKYVDHVEKMKVMAAETISVPEAAAGDRREFTFQPVSLTFDTARDSTNVGGDEYKYFIFGLRDPATKQLVDFQSNAPKVMSHVAKHPEARDALLAATKGSAFKEDFPKD